MTKAQFAVVLSALALFLILYFGFSTKSDKTKQTRPGQQVAAETVQMRSLLARAKEGLTEPQVMEITELEKQLGQAATDKEKLEILKQLSGRWYAFGHLAVAGGVAEQVADFEQTDEAWSVAGGTFFNALSASSDPELRKFCAGRAVKAFEKAAALSPESVEHQVNVALVWAENPNPENPMQAVMMLRELESKHPEEPAVYNALGRLAIKTGQWQRAVDRLEKSWSLDKNNPNTPCLLATAYEGAGNNEKSTEFAALCKRK